MVSPAPLHKNSDEQTMAGDDGDPRNGVLAHETKNGKHGTDGELTASPVKAFSAFGTGSRGGVNGGEALERESVRVRFNPRNS